MKKTITNRDIVIAVLLQKMIDFVFGRGSLHHFEWEELKPQGYIRPDTIAVLKVNFKVCFGPTHSIDLRAEFDLFKERTDINDGSWFYIFHQEPLAVVGIFHSLTRSSGIFFREGDGDPKKLEKFLNKLGFIK
jgi:hypothetical protein